MMSNNEKTLSVIGIVTMILSILLNVILINFYGGLGACFATLIILSFETILKVIIIRRKIGIDLIPRFKVFNVNRD